MYIAMRAGVVVHVYVLSGQPCSALSVSEMYRRACV
jgi:hypothetical protein